MGHAHGPQGVICPSPRLSGVLGTAGMVPTRRNRHSRRIASAANFSFAVQMMIKCYCARENGKEDSLALLSVRTPWAPAPSSKAGLTLCVLGAPCSDAGCGERSGGRGGGGRQIPVLGHVSSPRCTEHWGRSQESRWPLPPCPLFAVQPWTCRFIHQISHPYPVTGTQRPWSLPDAWGFSVTRALQAAGTA